MDSYLWLVIAALLFVGTHLGISSTRLRPMLVAKLGEKPYSGLYSLLSLLLITYLVSTYNSAPGMVFMWLPSVILHWLPVLLMPVALLFIVTGLTGNPSMSGNESAIDNEDLVRGIFRVTRHPVQWGIFLWAATHLLAAGDLASVIFFSSFAILSGVGTVLIDRKKLASLGSKWENFSHQTSNIPFAAVFQKRQRLVLSEFNYAVIAITLVLYILIWWGHNWLQIGNMMVNPFG